MRSFSTALCALALAACGGGSGDETTTAQTSTLMQEVSPSGEVEAATTQTGASLRADGPAGAKALESEIHSGTWLRESNGIIGGRYANLQADLPRHGRDGILVERPLRGGAAVVQLVFAEGLSDRLEPGWRYDRNAERRLQTAEAVVEALASQAYMQWTRHLDYDPGHLALVIGSPGDYCGGGVACHSQRVSYVPDLDVYAVLDLVILDESWVEENYNALWRNSETEVIQAFREMFFVLSHEAGHQFGYHNPRGIAEGCSERGCHAPYYSGSIMSYDHTIGRNVRYHVTKDDIRHVPNATWNDGASDLYEVWMLGEPSSIVGWGVWIDHSFEVRGRTDPRNFPGGNLSGTDEIAGAGWVQGQPSRNVSLATSATWSGEDNFLGVDLNSNYLGILLRADANLRYTFGNRPKLNLRVNDFEAHYVGDDDGFATWHDHNFSNWGDFTYRMDCTSGGCSSDSAEAKWYANGAGDPSGWVGGVVSDRSNDYAGSFVAEKD